MFFLKKNHSEDLCWEPYKSLSFFPSLDATFETITMALALTMMSSITHHT